MQVLEISDNLLPGWETTKEHHLAEKYRSYCCSLVTLSKEHLHNSC